jgi:hypothetical protein
MHWQLHAGMDHRLITKHGALAHDIDSSEEDVKTMQKMMRITRFSSTSFNDVLTTFLKKNLRMAVILICESDLKNRFEVFFD